jgi:hypothetical protein
MLMGFMLVTALRDRRRRFPLLTLMGCAGLTLACSSPSEVDLLRRFHLDETTELTNPQAVVLDHAVSFDGKGSVRVDATGPVVVPLIESGDLDVESAIITWTARLRAKDIEGNAYLEMSCRFPGRGEYFTRGLAHGISGSKTWTLSRTSFVLRDGENPDNIRLNLIMTGPGVAWVDDVRLLRVRKG